MSTPRSSGAAPIGADLVIPLMALAFAVYFFFSIRELPWEAKANGTMIGSTLLLLVVVQFIRIGTAVARGKATLGFDALWQPRDALGKRLGMVAVTIVFIATVQWLGLTLGLLLGMLASLWIMGVRRPKIIILVSLGVALISYALFIAALNSEFPHGPLEHLFGQLLNRS